MATQSVAARAAVAPEHQGRYHDLFVGSGRVLSITLSRDELRSFPPSLEHSCELGRMIHDLARAAKAVAYQAENDATQDMGFIVQSIEGIAEAITLLSQLSTAVQCEIANVEAGRA